MTMLRHWFASPELLLALLLVPALGVLASIDARRRRRVLAGMGGLPALAVTLRWANALRGLCLLLGLVLMAVAAAGPRWGNDTSQRAAPGRDLIVVLDCSNSMLAETPSRLERARAALLDLGNALARVGGHRVALVTFAARARIVCPLTHDYDHFRDTVRELDPQTFDADLGPVNGSASGTRIGLGLCEAVRCCDGRYAANTDIWLLSDGDDPARDGEWQAGIDAARASGLAVYAVAIGDPESADVIAVDSGTLRHDGKEVRTRLEEGPLRAIAEATGGVFFPARLRPVALGGLYLETIAARPQREDEDDKLPVNQDRAPLFYASSFGLLAGSILFGGITTGRIRRQA
jgi:Ca-activated chloride channel family protein